jgi:hypothetical protein
VTEDTDLVSKDLIPDDWKCLICGHNVLIWDIEFGRCSCISCDAPYTYFPNGMQSEEEPTIPPKCLVKSEWLEVVKVYWKETEKSILEITWKHLTEIGRRLYNETK